MGAPTKTRGAPIAVPAKLQLDPTVFVGPDLLSRLADDHRGLCSSDVGSLGARFGAKRDAAGDGGERTVTDPVCVFASGFLAA